MHSKLFAMTTPAGRLRRTIAGLAALAALLAAPAARAAFLPLPANGSQVNNDLANAIDPNQDAGVSDVAGGAVTAGKVPVPWATFEQKVAGGEQQIFARAFKNGAWVTQGFPASLNIDPSQEAEAPSIDFAGTGRTVPWVAWYEPSASSGWPTNIFASRFNAAANLWLPSGQGRGPNHLPSLNIHTLRSNDMVFAAKIVADSTADGGFRWVAVGNGTAGQINVLDTSGVHGFGNCADSQDAEDACSLNAIARRDAENPRVAAGTLTPGGTTVPWVVWQEDLGLGDGKHAIFVSRLVGGDHFALFNGGQPLSNTANDATRPDITFSGNVPYISWQEDISDAQVTFVGHFEGGARAPVFKLDTPTGVPNSKFGNAKDPLRAPISSGCTANPFNADGASCQGGAVGTPFFLYTAGDPGAQHLFAQAFVPTDVSTLAATDVSATDATLNGSANPGGAAILTRFDFGPTTNYGSATADARLDVASVATAFDATLNGLTQNETVHFRAVARTDFVTVDGPDQSFVVENVPPTASIDDLPDIVKRKDLGPGRLLTVQLTVSEPATITLDILSKNGRSLRQVTLNQTTAGSFAAQISLKHIQREVTLRVTATDAVGASAVVEQRFRAR